MRFYQMKQRRITHKNFEIAVIWADRLTFAPHSHDEYVLSCNISGNEQLILDGSPLQAPQSTTTLYNPGQVQSGDGTDCLVSIYLDARFFEKEYLADREVSFDTPIVTDEALRKRFTHLLGLVFNEAAPSVAEESLLEVVDCTTQRYSAMAETASPQADDWRVERVKSILLDRLAEQVSIEELAHETGLNKLALLRMFAKATGVPPITWQRAKRIEAARRLLKQGTSAADTAYLTGFSDQAHLTRWFGRAYGISPMQFARR